MIVVKTILADRPAKKRELNRRAHSRRTLRPPLGANLKFPELFSTQPLQAGSIKKSQAVAKERLAKIAK